MRAFQISSEKRVRALADRVVSACDNDAAMAWKERHRWVKVIPGKDQDARASLARRILTCFNILYVLFRVGSVGVLQELTENEKFARFWRDLDGRRILQERCEDVQRQDECFISIELDYWAIENVLRN